MNLVKRIHKSGHSVFHCAYLNVTELPQMGVDQFLHAGVRDSEMISIKMRNTLFVESVFLPVHEVQQGLVIPISGFPTVLKFFMITIQRVFEARCLISKYNNNNTK